MPRLSSDLAVGDDGRRAALPMRVSAAAAVTGLAVTGVGELSPRALCWATLLFESSYSLVVFGQSYPSKALAGKEPAVVVVSGGDSKLATAEGREFVAAVRSLGVVGGGGSSRRAARVNLRGRSRFPRGFCWAPSRSGSW